jgi:hypothetical protein
MRVRVYDDAGNEQVTQFTDRTGLFTLDTFEQLGTLIAELPEGWYVEDDATGNQYQREGE